MSLRVLKEKLLTDEFIEKYKHAPSPMSQLGNFVYYRTYSRYLPNEGRREYWWETVRRAVEYNCSLAPTTRDEAEKLFDNIFNLKQFLSGRTFWVGGTPVAEKYPMSNFNCSFTVVDDLKKFGELIYLLMIGSGVGVRILKDDVIKLPRLRTDIKLVNEPYEPREASKRRERSSYSVSKSERVGVLEVGDSKEGWTEAVNLSFKALTQAEIDTLRINYDSVRPKGEKLKTFGGTASGHESLKKMFEKIFRILNSKQSLLYKLQPIDCLDIVNIIGENVVSGGVRRTAEMCLIDSDDKECSDAKSNLYTQENGAWEVNHKIAHRQMSNNSIYYTSKPTREKLHWQLDRMRYSGEPAWINAEAGSARRSNMQGVNPCGEILLDANGMCNLTTVNVAAFVENGKLNVKELLEAQRLSARAGFRMTKVHLELPEWDKIHQRDKLLGCSLTGWQDMINATKMSKTAQKQLLMDLRDQAKSAATHCALGCMDTEPLLVTTIKPEGTLSQLPTVSSGVHYSHAPYFIRRVRISADDPLVKVCEELGYPVLPEVGQEWETCKTKVVEFPVKAPEGRTKYGVSAIRQLENYKMFMKYYVDHNCSITVHVRDHEWGDVEQWIWDNWDDTVAVSFLPLDDSFYELLPYEAIDETEYIKRVKGMKPFIPELISKYEKEETELDTGVSECVNGICPIR